jgi:gamma-tubulin complex component 3
MSSKNQRITDGIDSLVNKFLVPIPGEDPATTEERASNAIEFVTEVLQRYVFLLWNFANRTRS